jgi:precorrin-3B synthase
MTFSRRGVCPALSAPMQTGDGLLVRLNPIAGGVSPNVLIGLCESAARHGNGVMEVTARGSLQIRGLTLESAPLLAAEVDMLGIAVRTGVPVETGPLAGLDPDEIADPRPLAGRIRAGIEAAGLGSRLGLKVSVIVDGGGRLTMDTVLADVRLVAERRDAEISWRLAVAGDGRTASPLASLPELAAVNATLVILDAIAALGREGRARDMEPEHLAALALTSKSSRSTLPPSVLPDISPTRGEIGLSSPPSPTFNASARLGAAKRVAGTSKLLISPLVGEMSGRTEGGDVESERQPALAEPDLSRTVSDSSAPIGTFLLTESQHALSIALPFGSMPAEILIALANAAVSLGASEIRFAPRRTLLVIGLTEPACAELRSVAASLGFVTDPTDPRTKIAACPGAPACASGHIATRKIAEEIARTSVDIFNSSLSLHISGCAKGCAHPAEASLTLVGGEKGAGLVVSGTAKGLPAAYTPGYEAARGFGRIAELLRNQRRPGETTASCLARLSETQVAAAFHQG